MRDDCKRTFAIVKRSVLDNNLSILSKSAKSHLSALKGAIPMVKANAYGHGLVETARVFIQNSNTVALGVADLSEAIELRKANIRNPIWIFSGIGGLNSEIVSLLKRYQINPILSSVLDIQKYENLIQKNSLPNYQIKFNTGMNRLGVHLSDINQIRSLLKASKNFDGYCTHFAQALLEESSLTKRQIKEFKFIHSQLSGLNPKYVHAANSVTCLSKNLLKQLEFTNLIRPGIGLYGYAENKGVKLGIKPALTLKTRVIQNRILSKNESVGYDATFVCNKTMTQTVCAIGYGDGFHRTLSNKKILIKNKAIQILGRVSMDMTSFNLSAKLGDYVTILGEGHKQMDLLASNAQTISYEILTSLAPRVERIYK